MTISDNLARFSASVLETVQTRLELLSVETEARLQAYLRYLLCSLIAMVFASIGLLLLLLLVVAYYWDTHHLLALACMAGAFLGFSLCLFAWVKNNLAKQPTFFALSSAELARDVEQLRAAAERQD